MVPDYIEEDPTISWEYHFLKQLQISENGDCFIDQLVTVYLQDLGYS